MRILDALNRRLIAVTPIEKNRIGQVGIACIMGGYPREARCATEKWRGHVGVLTDGQTAIPSLTVTSPNGLFRRGEPDTIAILHSDRGWTVRLVIDVTATVADHVRRKRHCWLPPFPGWLRVGLAPQSALGLPSFGFEPGQRLVVGGVLPIPPGQPVPNHFPIERPPIGQPDIGNGSAVAVFIAFDDCDDLAERQFRCSSFGASAESWPDSGASMPASRILTWDFRAVRTVSVSPSVMPMTRARYSAADAEPTNNRTTR